LTSRRTWRSFDVVLLAVAILLLIYGVAMVASATRGTPDLASLWQRQAIYAISGLALLFLVAAFDYRFYENLHRPMYIVILVLLVALLVLGEITQGVQRWIGANAIQPSELAKVIIIIGLAKLLADHDGQMGRMRYLLLSFGYVLVPIVLVYLQPNLSTAITIGLIWLAMVLMAGGRLLHLGLLALGAVIVSPLFWLTLKDYMRDRIVLFLNPAGNPDTFYNVQQALISIGSGGWLGKGFGSGTQSQLRFLRVRHTDYIFSVIGEELGLIVCTLVLFLYYLIVMEGIKIAMHSKDKTGMLLAVSIISVMMTQIFYNLGMTLGLLPVVGVPLPFLSYGGSSMLFSMALMGILLNIHTSIKRFSV
jgi:rod shape determining protein RodA